MAQRIRARLPLPAWCVAVLAWWCPGAQAADCRDVTNCLLCASSRSFAAGGFAHCRWCPTTKTCHAFGSLFNTCGYNEDISEPDQCPAEAPAQGDEGDYVEASAVEMLAYASAAYCPVGKISDWSFKSDTCAARTRDFVVDAVIEGEVLGKATAVAFVGHNDARKQIVVGFKGSNSTADLVNIDALIGQRTLHYDFECALMVPEETLVTTHKGFCDYYMTLNNGFASGGSLESELEKVSARYQDYDVWFTGHSLGGAAAHLQAVTFALATGKAPTLLTFGQPRTGDVSLAALSDKVLKKGSARVTHGRDVIPHLSPCCRGRDRSCQRDHRCPVHAVREAWYPKDMTPGPDSHHRVCSDSDHEDLECSDGLSEDLSVADHLSYFGESVGAMCCFGVREDGEQDPIEPTDPFSSIDPNVYV